MWQQSVHKLCGLAWSLASWTLASRSLAFRTPASRLPASRTPASLRRRSLGRGSLGRGSLDRGPLGRRSLSRGRPGREFPVLWVRGLGANLYLGHAGVTALTVYTLKIRNYIEFLLLSNM